MAETKALYPGSVSGDPLRPFLERQGLLILDGALATELEARGADLSGGLWSARLLAEAPESLVELHLDYLRAGADCVISASYQATLEGFVDRGATHEEAERLVVRAVELAREARDRFWSSEASPGSPGRIRPLVAASVGPYGAALADGSEYTGDYALDEAGLRRFHRRRLALLAGAGADLLACETLPSLPEARALRSLLEELGGPPSWISFSCGDGARLRDGAPLREAVRAVDGTPGLCALGVNCLAPRHVDDALRELRAATERPLVVYPNSGEEWDAKSQRWLPCSEPFDLAAAGERWHAAGAHLLGGCCRTGPAQIAALRHRLLPRPS